VLAQHGAEMADNSGTVLVKDYHNCPLRGDLGVEAINLDDSQQLFAEDRAGNSACNLVGDNSCGKAGRNVFRRRVFGFVDTYSSFFGKDRRIY